MKLVVLGLGYSARAFVEETRKRFDTVLGTVRSAEKAKALSTAGIPTVVFDGARADPDLVPAMADADALLVSIAPDEAGDPVLRAFADTIAAAPRPSWIGYLSTVGVYGDHGGGWVDESTPCRPVSQRSRWRLAAEQAWLDLAGRTGKDVQIFRLSGIYGPRRNPLANLAEGTARRLVKPGQVFNRIHVADIAGAVAAAHAAADRPAIVNVTDDEPAPPQDVVAHAAALLGVAPPPEQDFATAELSPMARSFYGENKRVSNRLLRERIGYRLRYPTYREGLQALMEAGEGRAQAA